MKHISIILVVFFLLVGLGCAQHPVILNIEQEPVPGNISGKQFSLGDVEHNILSACQKKGWSANVVEPGRILASITVRTRHRAKIEIRFSEIDYSINYVESTGLEYKNGRIHGRYNHWIARLDAEIKKEFGLRTQPY